jgi:hypothetical protein
MLEIHATAYSENSPFFIKRQSIAMVNSTMATLSKIKLNGIPKIGSSNFNIPDFPETLKILARLVSNKMSPAERLNNFDSFSCI